MDCVGLVPLGSNLLGEDDMFGATGFSMAGNMMPGSSMSSEEDPRAKLREKRMQMQNERRKKK